MCKQEMVSGYVRFRCGVAHGAVGAEGRGAAPRWQRARVETAYTLDVGLVDGDPVLHSVPEALEARFGICGIIVSAHNRNTVKFKKEESI
jgi:hypothetical protein